MVGGEVVAGEFFADAVEERIEFGEERLRRQAVPLGIPHPFVAHGADAALDELRAGMPQSVAATMSQCSKAEANLVALVRIVAQPMEQLGEAPLVRVDAAAPVDGFELFAVRRAR